MRLHQSKRRHSRLCPCHEHIKIQTKYFAPLLRKLGGSGLKKREKVVVNSDPCFIRYISKCADGILNSHIHLTKDRYSLLNGSKKLLLTLVNKKTPLKVKKNALIKDSKSGLFSILTDIASSS